MHSSSAVVIASAKDLYGRWHVLTHEEKDTIINSITDDIVVGERNITFNIRYVPFSAKGGNYMQNTLSLLPSGSRK